MSVVDFRRRPTPPEREGLFLGRSGVPAHGSFPGPDGAVGEMRGWMRFLRVTSAQSRLRCLVVVSGVLYDSRRERIGMGSRRCLVPVALPAGRTRDAGVLVGPVCVPLLGFDVVLEQIRLELRGASLVGLPGEGRQGA